MTRSRSFALALCAAVLVPACANPSPRSPPADATAAKPSTGSTAAASQPSAIPTQVQATPELSAEVMAAVEARANEIVAAAASAEPSTTSQLQALATKMGGEMYKLEHRLKKRGSLLRKMKKILAKDPAKDAASLTVNDALRYTMRIEDQPPGHYVQSIRRALVDLTSQGHQVEKLKNYWPRGDNYSGVNTVLRTKDGLLWELQFHTQASIKTNAATRSAYEELRRLNTPPDKKKALFDQMAAAWEPVPIPKDVLKAHSLHDLEAIIQLPRPGSSAAAPP